MEQKSSELFNLCKQVYEKTEWDRFVKGEQKQWIAEWWWTYNGKLQDEPIDVLKLLSDQRVCPLYTSDYLLEKLLPITYSIQVYRRQTGLIDLMWMPQKPMYDDVVSDTPLKALLKLCLALHESGQL